MSSYPPPPAATRRIPWLGVPIAVVFAVASLASILYRTSGDHLTSLAPREAEAIALVPLVLLAAMVLIAGLLETRIAGGLIGGLLVLVAGIAATELNLRAPEISAKRHLSLDQVTHMLDVVSVVTTLMMVAGYGLARRQGMAWWLGLVPALVLAIVAQVIYHRRDHVDSLSDIRGVLIGNDVIGLVILLLMVCCCWGVGAMSRSTPPRPSRYVPPAPEAISPDSPDPSTPPTHTSL